MKINKLEINNFRGFRKATIEFPDSNLAVFIGVNGQGKSSLMDLISLFLTDFLISAGDKNNFSDFALKITDIHIKEFESVNTITVEDILQLRNSQPGKSIFWTNSIQNGNGFGVKSQKELRYSVLDLRQKLEKENSLTNVPVLNFYGANRHFDNDYTFKPKRNVRSNRFPQFASYEGAFEKKLNNFNDFIAWYREQEDYENEQINRKKDFSYRNPQLEGLRKSIISFFSKVGKVSFDNLRIERGINDDLYFGKGETRPSLVISKNNEDFRIEQLSDGEKMLLMVVCDIARRLSIANPGLNDSLQGQGIVLIDEIELHLHPKWQREVIPALMATFPNIQFIISTHSPQVLSRVDSKNIFLLKDGDVFTLSSNPIGLDTNVILEEVMDTTKYPFEVEELVNNLFRFIDQRKFKEAEEVRRQIAGISPDNPVLQRAEAMIERLKILN